MSRWLIEVDMTLVEDIMTFVHRETRTWDESLRNDLQGELSDILDYGITYQSHAGRMVAYPPDEIYQVLDSYGLISIGSVLQLKDK